MTGFFLLNHQLTKRSRTGRLERRSRCLSLGQESKTARAGLWERKRNWAIALRNAVARGGGRYLLLRWTRNETPQLSVERVLDIASWIEPNGWVIGSAHYLSFVINVCCCNKRLGPSVVRGTNGFELLYNGRQNTQSHRRHNRAVNEQTNSNRDG